MPRQVQGADIPADGGPVGQVPEAVLHASQHGPVQVARPTWQAGAAVAQGRTIERIALLST